jgi:hypothetical protein
MDAKRIHDMEQVAAAVGDFARQVAAFRAALHREGLPDSEALALAAIYVTEMVRGLRAKQARDE